MKVRLGDVCEISSGGTPARNCREYWYEGTIPWVKIGDFIGKYLNETEEKITELGLNNSSAKLFPKGTILYTIFATLGEVCILNIDASTNQAICGLRIKDNNIDVNYLYFYLCSIKDSVTAQGRGVAQNNINLSILRSLEIEVCSLDKQRKIASVLDSITALVEKRKRQLEKLDLLIKSKFIETFGDPNKNDKHLPSSSMIDVCSIIDGDRGVNYPKQEELMPNGYCLFLSAKNVTKKGFAFDECVYISQEKDQLLHNGRLTRGDVVLTTRGTIGNLAFYSDDIPFENIRINSGMVILRMKQGLLNEKFFIQQFSMQLDEIIRKIASGSAQPQLPITTMKNINILLPPIELQNEFARFVEQNNSVKLSIKHSLNKLETLKKALMQKYFG